MSDWTGLTKEQTFELVDHVHEVVEYAVKNASCLQSIPSVDAEIDKRLRAHGCPDDQLATWRKQIKEWPFEAMKTPMSRPGADDLNEDFLAKD